MKDYVALCNILLVLLDTCVNWKNVANFFESIRQICSTAGGTGFNGVVEDLKKLTTHVAHVLPVSDDGGSTAEIVRVLGESST